MPASRFKKFLLVALGLLGGRLEVATYNIRYNNTQDTVNAWARRLPYLANLIRFQDFDVFGTQEVLHHQPLTVV